MAVLTAPGVTSGGGQCASNKIAVVDTWEDKLAALVDVGKTRTPAVAPTSLTKYGPVWATSHLAPRT